MEGPLVWLAMARAHGIGRMRLAAVMAACPDPHDAWTLSTADLVALGLPRRAAEALVQVRRDPQVLRMAEADLAAAGKAGLRFVSLPDPDYPLRLRQTPNPPPYFYQAGPWQPDQRSAVAVVGTRKPTAYGLSVARRFTRELAEAGVVIVSGMARGIDCAAHKGALDAGGTTVAVLGGGADICYPPEALALYQRIRETGAVISEQPPGCEPRAEFFPERNRIISGLSDAILVVEAGERSGTLITVEAALQQGRDVFAVPGSVHSPMSVGPHRLVREGACLVTSAAEILAELGAVQHRLPVTPALPPGLSSDEERLLGWMGAEPRWAGDLAEACGLSAAAVQGILTMLEVRGLARQLPGGQYERIG